LRKNGIGSLEEGGFEEVSSSFSLSRTPLDPLESSFPDDRWAAFQRIKSALLWNFQPKYFLFFCDHVQEAKEAPERRRIDQHK
jgi:hypothetical protein